MAEAEQQSSAQVENRFHTSMNALQLRLNTQPLLDTLEAFLKGKRIVYRDAEDGKIIAEKLTVGTPKANDEGVQSIMSYVSAIINPATVQGNFDAEQYDRYIYRCRMELSQDIVTNRGNYDIDGDYMNLIIDFVMALIEAYMSRTLENKERESYVDTLKMIESSRLEREAKRGLFSSRKD